MPSAPRVPHVGRTAMGAAPTAAVALPRTALLRYMGAGPIVVRGVGTGAAYVFDARRTVQAVDARDVDGLIRKGIFRRP